MDDRQHALTLTPVSRETLARLDAYVALLLTWQQKTNLIAPSTISQIWTRHVADSLQLLKHAAPQQTWLDIGSGGGFPGVALACVLADAGGHIHLVERNGKKAAFLREALRVTGGAGTLHVADVADLASRPSLAVDIVTARAVAPLATLLGWAEPWLARNARGLFLKGQDVEPELLEATKCGRFFCRLRPSLTGSGHIVDVHAANRETPHE